MKNNTQPTELQLFTNELFGNVRAININGKVMFVGKDVATCLGYKDTAQAIRNHCKGVVETTTPTNGGVQTMKVITQYDVIRLIMKSRLPQAQEFEKWVIEEVIPQVLTTGTYSIKQDSYMIEDPVERAKRWIEEYEEKKALLELTQQQQETIKEQEVEIEHKEDVIITLVEDVDLMTKRQRISQIVKYGSQGRYSERWSLLYKEFETKYHIDVNRRMKRAKENGTFKKSGSKLEYICDVMGMTSQLFDVCVVVFEADYKDMLQYYLDLAKGE